MSRSKGTVLLDKIGLLLLPGVAEIRGEGVERGYNAAIRDVISLLTLDGDEGQDDKDVIEYVIRYLKNNLDEYGMTGLPEFLNEVDE